MRALIAAMAVFFAVTPLAVTGQPLDRPGTALTATFVSSDAFALVVRTDAGELVSFLVDDIASVPAGIVAGTRVTVRYASDAEGRHHAVRVGIATHPDDPAATTSPPPPAATEGVVRAGLPSEAPAAVEEGDGGASARPSRRPVQRTSSPGPERLADEAVAGMPSARAVAAPSVDPRSQPTPFESSNPPSAPAMRVLISLAVLLVLAGALMALAVARQ